ncbi:NmrA domain-containing protein [Mycena kentingensis (nom. inval.)]|nr:NmrA domain-containing protein [Mycena kentingensis (nom. inval.)]
MTIATSDHTAPLVVVVGITGNQGGSVARALIESDRAYRIRGLTRDVDKPAAKAFAEQGVELVQVALTVGNEGAARAAFAGADIVFVSVPATELEEQDLIHAQSVTNFGEHADYEREVAEGKLIVDAAKLSSPSLKLFIWSGIESVTELSGGRLSNAKFFDSKAVVTAYARDSGIPLAVVEAGYYMDNIFNAVSSALVAKGASAYTFGFPMAKGTLLPFIDVAGDYGLYVRAAIERPELGAGSEVLSGTILEIGDAIRQLAEFSGKNIVYEPISIEQFAESFPYKPVVPILSDMYQFYESIGYYGAKKPSPATILVRRPKTWREYLEGLGRDEVVRRLGLGNA